jgi:hypothetical protein
MDAVLDRFLSDPANRTPKATAAPARLRWVALVYVIAWIVTLGFFAGMPMAATPEGPTLADRYETMRPRMAASAFGRPLVVDSGELEGRLHGVIHAELAEPFAPMATRLTTPRAWCDVVVLHVNVKGCAVDGDFVTMYSGRKFYEPIARTHAIRYAFRVAAVRADYVRIVLAADAGPLGTRDYEIVLEAMPVGSRTFVAVHYGFRPSAGSRLATASYLATVGSGKVGFTIVAAGSDGRPERIGGVRGIVERNAMRNFLALEAWLQTRDVPETDRFERRLRRMAALTERYPEQLVELPAAEYTAIKRREWQEQLPKE